MIEHVIGWDVTEGCAKRKGGIFGVPKAWARVVEEQSRLTLHAHCLIWFAGNRNIDKQFRGSVNTSTNHYW